MKPHNLLNAETDQQFGNHYSHDEVEGEQGNSLLKNVVTSLVAMMVVFALFAFSPYFISFLAQPKVLLEKVEQAPKEPLTQEFLEAFIWTAKLKLEDLKLNHRLQIDLDSNSQFKIDGNISAQEMPNWKKFLKWYDSKQGFPKLVHTVNASAVVGNIPQLKSVWFDAKPTAYFADGSFGNIGTVLEDGWRIVSIEAWAVFVERDGVTITLSY